MFSSGHLGLDVSMGRHEKAALEGHRRLLLTEDDVGGPEGDLALDKDSDNYCDTRAELNATGHNVVNNFGEICHLPTLIIMFFSWW